MSWLLVIWLEGLAVMVMPTGPDFNTCEAILNAVVTDIAARVTEHGQVLDPSTGLPVDDKDWRTAIVTCESDPIAIGQEY